MNGSNAARLQQQRPLPGGMSRSQLATERDDIQKRIARVLLVVADPSASVRAPIIVLQVCNMINQHGMPTVLCRVRWPWPDFGGANPR